MKKAWKSLISGVLVLALVLGLLPQGIPIACAASYEPEAGDIVILYTNDVHCAVDQVTNDAGNVTNIGYAGVAAYKKEMEAINGVYVTLADTGDAMQGAAIGTLSQGKYITDSIYQVGYDVFVPGNHEFDYGMERMQFLMNELTDNGIEVVSSNFTDLEENKLVYEPYTIRTYGEGADATKVAFVGITTPESFTKSTPAYFQDEDGTYIYGFGEGNDGLDLYDTVQNAVNDAIAEDADYVIALGHLGIDVQSEPWRSTDVIANTTGIDVFVDGHSHSVVEGDLVQNKEGDDVLLTQAGTKLENIGRMIITPGGEIKTKLIAGYAEQDAETASFIADIEADYAEDLAEVVGYTSVDLMVNDSATGNRLVRRAETNLGDLCADAYRYVLGNGKTGVESGPADIAFVNGGGIRTDIDAGDITFGDVIMVHPFNNAGCVVEATGQEILDALEMGARVAPAENGGFLQVSGLTYYIDTTVASSVVVDDKKNFVEVSGDRRVKNVKVGGEAIEADKMYTLASHNYMLLNGGDGINMFQDNEVVVQPVLLDNQILTSYIQDNLSGSVGEEYSNPYGQGRIAVGGTQATGFVDDTASLGIRKIARYSTGEYDEDGGIQEIVTYNPANQFSYSVNGRDGLITTVYMGGLDSGSTSVALLDGSDIDVSELVNIDGFTYGDMTSIAVSPDRTRLAVAIQEEAYDEPGRVAIFDCDSDGALSFVTAYETGVQPDMVIFADNNTVMTADEGEPRMGYVSANDPKGSVTVVDVASGSSTIADFTAFDATRDELVAAGVVLKKETAPSVDLEPEYIAVADSKAYVSLQEANAVAVLDINSRQFTGVYPLGVQDYSQIAIDLDNTSDDGGEYTPRYYEDTFGLRMPDGIAAYQKGGKTYVLTANEGDSREWEEGTEEYSNEEKDKLKATDGTKTSSKVRMLSDDNEGLPGLSDGSKNYLFGGRSFSLYEAGDKGLTLVYDSGADFESKTAEYLPDYFNCSNDDRDRDSRSNKKGPEPETVTVGTVDGKTYAFIALERIGGVMVYNVTDPNKVSFVNYINSRDFEDVDKNGIGEDDSPEGLKFISAEDSPNGEALLLAAFEVSGDMATYALTSQKTNEEPLELAIISDSHLYDGDTLGDDGAAFEEYLVNDRKMLKESESILDETIRRILYSNAEYVLVSGDLTKDGEAGNHELFAKKMEELKQYGKQVFVINGNHDISNADAVSYDGDETTSVDTIDSSDFKSIYSSFGYSQTVAEDANSLSYSVNLGDDYRLIVIDSCIYNDDKGEGRSQETGGQLSEKTLHWVLAQAKAAIKAGRRPIGMMHHGVVSHTAAQPQFFPEYLVDDYEMISQELADAGIGLVFTGHFHSQDVSVTQTKSGKKLYDMETGSLLTYPAPIRFVTLDGDDVTYSSVHIDSVDGIDDFETYAQGYLMEGLVGMVPGMLKAVDSTLTDETAAGMANMVIPGSSSTIAQFLAACMAKHYVGDETPGDYEGIISAFQNYNAEDDATNALYQMLGNVAWALANDTTGDLTAPALDTVADNDGNFTLSSLPTYSSGGSGGSKKSSVTSGSETTTKENADGSMTTTVTDPTTGTVTKTTVWPNGSKTVVLEKEDGTVTTTTTAASGVKSETVTTPEGNTTARITLASRGTRTVVRIPVPNANAGTVAVLVRDDGTEEILRMSVAENGELLIPLSESANIKIIQKDSSFSDTRSHWASEAVSFVAARGLFSGTSENNFSPNVFMTRGMLVTVLHRLENKPKGGEQSFEDVKPDKYYAEAVAWAAQNNIVSGTDNGFQPDNDISREQLIAILYRYAAPGQIDGGLDKFSDRAAVSSWATDAMRWAVGSGLITGGSNRNLNPGGSATRAEVATILERYVINMANESKGE